ncbi:MAG: T9SS type A sorting domain-containing protein, partial [Lewinella sp.]|nr:T9SS type A sorting domain-containing protein [Lewinella sp.]
AYTSNNGINWGLPVNTQVITMDDCLEVGLIVTNVPFATNVTATFSGVEVSGGNEVRPDAPTDNGTITSQLQAYPNPTTGKATVNLSAFMEQDATLEVLDLNGQLILQRPLGIIEHRTERVDLHGQPAGVYLLRLRTADGTTAVRRVIVQRRP